MTELISLGKTDIAITPMGLGTWQWGDRMFWSYGKSHNNADIQAAFEISLNAGINFYDTAEVYGMGRSERMLGEYTHATKQPLVIATKFFPFPWRFWKGALRNALRASLRRLGMERVDLYHIHWPYPPVSVETWAEGLADVVQEGLTRAVGVSNYNVDQMRRAHIVLSRRKIPLASNQVYYNLLDRTVEKNGLLELCKELGVTLIAYSPLAMGVLTGKYTAEKIPPGIRGRRYNAALLAKVQPLIRKMREIGDAHGKSPSQVALNWLICKGTVPIPGAKNARQAQENTGALGWRLTDIEVATLDEVSDAVA